MIREESLICLLCFFNDYTKSQEVEPGVYAALPKNLNTIAVGCGFSRGNVLIDPSLPVTNFKVSLQSLTGVYKVVSLVYQQIF